MKTYSLGIDVGYSSIKVVLINNLDEIEYDNYVLHKSKIKKTLESILLDISGKFKLSSIVTGAITGSVGKQLSNKLSIKKVYEVISIIEGCRYLNIEAQSIIEIGGQSARYITGFNSNKKNALKISSNNDCAAGTGSFIEEQVSRLNIKIEEFASYVQKASTIPRIAGRCSVFAKTDIIHHQQEGVSFQDILKGLSYAIVKNYKNAVIKRSPVENPILFIGGVAHNQAIADALRDVLDKSEKELITPEYFSHAAAIGTALIAKREKHKLVFHSMVSDFLFLDEVGSQQINEEILPALRSVGNDTIESKHSLQNSSGNITDEGFFLGIDIGSTSTNLVLINKEKEISNYKYVKTRGNPLEAVYEGFKQIQTEINGKINIVGVGITGSGRHMIGKVIGADVIKDEITAQAKAAVKFVPDVDTIFEIGGQDSKYISITNGAITDFQMNKICAAGTGSFLEEQAKKFNIPLNKLGELALKGRHPVNLGERCTVFIESSVASSLSNGKKTEDIVSGLCYSIAKNYLHRVVGQKKIGKKILLQGGIAYNQGVVNAMRILTKKDITITPYFSVTGAFGAALIANEEIKEGKTKFVGFENLNQLTLSVEKQIHKNKKSNLDKYNKKIEEIIFEDYANSIDQSKKTVGIPRALFTYGMFPMFNAIFKSLGFNVLLSEWSDENTIKLAQEFALEETCFPVKLILGHVAELVSKGVDYIFFPDLYTVNHPGSQSRQNYGCAYMQLAYKIVNHTMQLEKKGIKIVAPTIAFSLGSKFMNNSFSALGELLGKSKEETDLAVKKGIEAYQRFEKRIEKNGEKVIKKLDPDKITFVIISKTYGVSDPVLNLGIPAKLMDMGYQVIPFFDLPEGANVSKEHPNMFWPFGQHILEPAYLVREHPNIYAILLTHHGCGPDSVLIHYFKEIMGNKPYLNVEIDEHASQIGVNTRIEAFVNSLKSNKQVAPRELRTYLKNISYNNLNIKNNLKELNQETKIYIPNVYPYSDLFKEVLIQKGFDTEILTTNGHTIELGRRHTINNEYYSLTSLLGDCFSIIDGNYDDQNISFVIPQTEGAEVEGQYNRILRTKLDENKHNRINIIAPYLEDLIKIEFSELKLIFYCILSGDIIRAANQKDRNKYLLQIKKLIRKRNLNILNLKEIARDVYKSVRKKSYAKRILAIGEPMVLFNDFLNDNTFKTIEEQSNKVIYSSFSETIWVFWKDHITTNKKLGSVAIKNRLLYLKEDIEQISKQLKEESPFTPNIDDLIKKANRTIGYYAGGFARYRQAKALCNSIKIDGIITASSLYENTGISLNILHKGFSTDNSKPVLNLTFDGNSNENNKSKIESFMYYL